MPTREAIQTSTVDVTHVVNVVVDPVKYDNCTFPRAVSEKVPRDEELLEPMEDVLPTSSAAQSESSSALSKKTQSRALSQDYTSIRIPT